MGSGSQCLQLVDQYAGADGIEYRAEINKQHPSACVRAIQVVEGSVEGFEDGWGTVGLVGQMMLVEASWDVGFNVPQCHSTMHTMITGIRVTGW